MRGRSSRALVVFECGRALCGRAKWRRVKTQRCCGMREAFRQGLSACYDNRATTLARRLLKTPHVETAAPKPGGDTLQRVVRRPVAGDVDGHPSPGCQVAPQQLACARSERG